MNHTQVNRQGLAGTIIFHGIILFLLLFFGLPVIFPPPPEEGVLVNFGESETGLGLVEPAPGPSTKPAASSQSQKNEESASLPSVPVTPPRVKPKPAKEEVMTQDYEKTAALKEEERKKQEKLKEEKRIQDELERQRLAEVERERKAERERIAREEAERKRLAEEQRKIDEINSRTKDAFGKSGTTAQQGTGPGGQGTGQNPNQGVTFPGGNQGVPTGDPNSGNYGPGGRGPGSQGSGISYNLSGRSALSMPKPDYPGNDAGIVVVQVSVDKNGNVTKAVAGFRGTTLADQEFWTAAQQAAMKAKFNVSADAPAIQQGTITYKFTLQ